MASQLLSTGRSNRAHRRARGKGRTRSPIAGIALFRLTEVALPTPTCLQEVTKDRRLQLLHQGLDSRYPYSVAEFSIVSLEIPDQDRRPRRPARLSQWIRLLARWVEIDHRRSGRGPLRAAFYPVLQEHDATALTQFVLTRKLPIIVAGDFNMTPWTDQLKQFTRTTGLGQFNTFHFTWPMRWRRYPLVPAVVIKRLVAERPDALGLTVPGMPAGSPGMEQGDETEPYDVLLIKKDGTAEIFTRH